METASVITLIDIPTKTPVQGLIKHYKCDTGPAPGGAPLGGDRRRGAPGRPGEGRYGRALAIAALALVTAAVLLAAQPGGWASAPSGDGGAAVPDAWPPSGDAAFAGLLPRYAFAQVQDTTSPVFVSSELDGDAVLTITFSETIDVTPAANVVAAKIHVRESGSYAGGITLTAGELDTAADSSTISFTLNATHQAAVALLSVPELTIEPGAVRDTSGNPIAGTFDASTAVFIDATSVSAQETSPRGMAFSSDGTKMFVTGNSGDDVNEYSLSAPFDASTATFVNATSVSAQETSPHGIAFSSDGAKMFVIGANGNDVNEYSLSAPFDASTAVFIDATSVSAQTGFASAMAFSSDGARMFVIGATDKVVNEYSLSAPFDASTATFVDAISVSAQEGFPAGIAFSSDGAKMFVTGTDGDNVNEYSLSAPFDASTATFVDAISVSAQDGLPSDVAFSSDGTKMFILGDDGNDVNEYALSSVYPITTTSPVFVSSELDGDAVLTITFSETIDVTPAANVVAAKIHVRESGSYAGGITLTAGELDTAADSSTISFTLNATHQAAVALLSVPELTIEPGAVRDTSGNPIAGTFDASTAVFIDATSVSAQETSPRGMAFSSDGTKMFVTGNSGDDVNEYSLSAPFDASTATFVNATSVSAQETSPHGIAFSSDGAKMFVIGANGNDVNEYSLSAPFDASTAVFIDATSVSAQTGFASAMAFSSDGARMFVIGATDKVVNEYSLSAPFDASTATFVDAISVSAQEGFPAGIAFSSDGAKMFVTGTDGDNVNEYSLSAPFDASTATFVDAISVSAQDGLPSDVAFSSDGTKMFILGDDGNDVNEYALSSVYPITTTSPVFVSSELDGDAVLTITFSETIDVTPAANVVAAKIHVRESGSYAGGITLTAGELDTAADSSTISFTLNATHQAAVALLSVPELTIEPGAVRDTSGNPIAGTFDASTAVFIDATSVSAQETSPRGMAFSSDGTKMFVTGNSGDDVNEYSLSAPFDASTATFVNATSVSAQETSPHGIAFSSDGAKMFVIGANGNDVNEYSLSAPFDASTAVFIDATSVSAQTGFASAMAFSSDGARMFVIGATDKVVNEYSLSAPFDASTATFVDAISVSAQEGFPAGIAFSSDGAKMFVTGTDGDNVNEYSLSAPFDASTATFVDAISVSAQDGLPSDVAFSSDGTKMFILGDDGNDVNEYALSSVYPITVLSTVVNTPPVVGAGADQTVDEGDTVTLSGTASDSDNDPLTYMWTHDSDLPITLADDTALSTTFTAPAVTQDTTVTFTLAVSDDTDSVTDMVSVTITDTTPGSIPPAVDAGPGLTAADSITDTGALKLFNARGIATFESGGNTYAAVTGYLDYGVQILDVTDPYGITAAGSISDDAALELAGAWDVATFTSGGGTYAAVTAYFGDGVQILNVTDPSDITATDSIGDTETRELSGAFGIATFTSGSRTYAAVTALWDDDGVQILDVTNPSDITAAGSIGDTRTLELSGASDVATFTSGGRTYAAVAAYWDDGVQILDVTNPSSVTAAGSIGDTAALELDGAHDITTFESGGRAYAAVAAYWDDGVQILDVTDPSAITAAGSITDDAALELDGAEGITVFESGGRTYAAVASVVDDGVQMLDITDPSDITAVGSITDDAALELLGASGIATFTSGGDTYAAVTAHFDSGVQILRLTGGGAILTASSQFVGEPDNAQGFAESGTVIPRLAIRDLSVQVAPDSPPTVTSIERSDPAGAATSERTLVFAVTFSEDVTGVDLSDFALSPDSTGGGSAPGQFTHTSEPATRIADRSTIQDAITVDRSGTATSVSVAVDISHTYRGDLVIDLIAPDGTSQTLHSRAGGSANDIDRTYAPDFDGTGIAGDWTLRVSDRAGGDVGTLNGWTLTIGHGTAGSPVTGLAGSGSQYLVTVSAAQDGTYNLDLVSSGHGITDAADNPLSSPTPTGADHTYTVSATVTDSTAPTLASIERYSPADQNTDSQTLVYKVTFSEDVTGVDTGDFVLSQGSTGTGSTASLTGSGSVYYATVSAAQDGTYNLDLVSSGHGITDSASNPLSSQAPTGADHTYTVSAIPADATAPTVTSIERSDPAEAATSERTLVFAVTFSEDVTGVDAGDFALSPGSTGGGSSSGQFTQTSEPATRIADRSTIQDAITVDRSGTATSVSVAVDISHTYRGDLVIDLIAPDGTSQTLHSRTGGSANDIDRTYTPDFDGTGIAGDWTLRVSDRAGGDVGTLNGWTLTIGHGTAGSPVTGLTGSGDAYLVTVSAAQDGTYNLDLVSSGHGIADTASNPLTNTAPTGTDHTYTVSTTVTDSTAPTLASIERYSPADQDTDSQTLVYKVTFSEDVTGVDTGDFVLSQGSTGTGSTASLTGSGSVYYATVSAAQDGTYNLDLVSSGHGITDAASNPLSSPAPTGADHTYTVSAIPADTAAPTVTSIERSDPAEAATSGRTLVFAVTFSEDVTGVDAGDFELSPGSTGGGSAPGQFTQTSEPALRIADRSTIQDAITVDRSGTATSVSVAVDISHTYRGDLVIVLIAPDGTAQTLHSRTGGSANDIDRTYTPDFDGTGIAGDWTLRVSDRAGGDVGTLNGWTLTIGHGGAGSPVTGLAGSGDAYLVTVSAAQDGTYNLDLVSSGHGITDSAGNPLSSPTPTGADHTYTVRTPAIQGDTINTPPSVSAGPDQTVQGGQVVSLTGTATDVDGDPLTYSWSHDSALAIEFANSTAPSTTFTAPQVSSNTTFTLTLTVDDGTQAASDSMGITIVETPEPPRYIGEITLTSTGPGVIEASWEAPTETPADYRMAWAKVGEPYLTWTDLSGNAFPTSPSQTVTGLEEGEQYKVKVRARYSSGGPGDWSGEFTVTVAGTG